jgi:serine/threonine protein phosphatase PrpC
MSYVVDAVEVASLTDVGRQRSNNQDAYGELRGESGACLLIVADGMGGHAGGATASRLAVETVEQIFRASTDAPDVMLRAALEAANREVHNRANNDSSLAGMGTTGVALLLPASGPGWVANVGDSRAYRLRGGQLEQLTLDHSLVAELERRGMLTPEEALVHPRRNEVLRSLGVEPDVMVDLTEIDVLPGDQFLLCSDGLSGVVSDDEIASLMAGHPPAEAARRLVDAANDRGGPDNVTVQIARIPPLPAPQEDPRERQRRIERVERQKRARRLLTALLAVAAILTGALLWVLVDELSR